MTAFSPYPSPPEKERDAELSAGGTVELRPSPGAHFDTATGSCSISPPAKRGERVGERATNAQADKVGFANWIQYVTHTAYDNKGAWNPIPGEKAVSFNSHTEQKHIDVFVARLHNAPSI